VLDNIIENLELIEPSQTFFIFKISSQSLNKYMCCVVAHTSRAKNWKHLTVL